MRSFLFCLCSCFFSLLLAQKITSLDIQGQSNFPTVFLQKVIVSKPETVFNPEHWNQDLKRLYSFGFAQQLTFTHQIHDTLNTIALHIQIQENPLLLEIEFDGNTHFSSEFLLTQINLRPGTYLSDYEVQQAQQDLEQIYKEQGFWFIQIQTSFQNQDQKGLLRFSFQEGPAVKVEQVLLEGMVSFTPESVSPYLLTPPKGELWKTEFLSQQKLEMDRMTLIHFYRSRGFLDVQVASAEIRYEADQQKVLPVFRIQEGIQYRLEQIRFYGNSFIPEEQLRPLLTMKPGQVFMQKEFTQDLRMLYQKYHSSPYHAFQIEPEILVYADSQDPRIQVSFYFLEE